MKRVDIVLSLSISLEVYILHCCNLSLVLPGINILIYILRPYFCNILYNFPFLLFKYNFHILVLIEYDIFYCCKLKF